MLILTRMRIAVRIAVRITVRITSGAKSDPADAARIEDYLRRHRDALRPWLQ
jgi:hypothetical protein